MTGGTSGYTYAWSNGKTSADLNPPTTAGIYTVTVTDATGCTKVASFTVHSPCFREGSNPNTTEVTEDIIKVYPNPSQGIFYVQIPADNKDAEILINDVSGRIIDRKIITENDGTPIQFNLGNVPSGMYFVQIHAGNKTQNDKIIKS